MPIWGSGLLDSLREMWTERYSDTLVPEPPTHNLDVGSLDWTLPDIRSSTYRAPTSGLYQVNIAGLPIREYRDLTSQDMATDFYRRSAELEAQRLRIEQIQNSMSAMSSIQTLINNGLIDAAWANEIIMGLPPKKAAPKVWFVRKKA